MPPSRKKSWLTSRRITEPQCTSNTTTCSGKSWLKWNQWTWWCCSLGSFLPLTILMQLPHAVWVKCWHNLPHVQPESSNGVQPKTRSSKTALAALTSLSSSSSIPPLVQPRVMPTPMMLWLWRTRSMGDQDRDYIMGVSEDDVDQDDDGSGWESDSWECHQLWSWVSDWGQLPHMLRHWNCSSKFCP